jgi:ubiquinone/menaquinone biosynthesis C-methylase UbiE
MHSWWRSYFGEDFFHLHVDLFPEAESRAEVAAMIELLGVPVQSRLLDVPCGWGRHARLLVEAGYDVVGADLSPDLLSHADGCPALCGADLRCLPFGDHSFDAAINVFTSLGLFIDEADDVAALSEIRRVLRPGGRFLFETMHRDEVLTDYAERDQWTLPNGTEVRVRRRFDPVTGISREELRWRRGRTCGVKRNALRLRTATEVEGLFRAAGFSSMQYFGNWNGSRFTHRSPRLVVVAEA